MGTIVLTIDGMKIVLVSGDSKTADWLAHVLGDAGFSVVILPEVSPASPELKSADLVIADEAGAAGLGDGGPSRRLLLSSRGSTVDLGVIQGRFSDVLALPTSGEDVVARVRHAAGQKKSH